MVGIRLDWSLFHRLRGRVSPELYGHPSGNKRFARCLRLVSAPFITSESPSFCRFLASIHRGCRDMNSKVYGCWERRWNFLIASANLLETEFRVFCNRNRTGQHSKSGPARLRQEFRHNRQSGVKRTELHSSRGRSLDDGHPYYKTISLRRKSQGNRVCRVTPSLLIVRGLQIPTRARTYKSIWRRGRR